jgi:hypothetical protein
MGMGLEVLPYPARIGSLLATFQDRINCFEGFGNYLKVDHEWLSIFCSDGKWTNRPGPAGKERTNVRALHATTGEDGDGSLTLASEQ